MIELNDQSRQFAGALFEAFPAWREFQLAHDTETFSLPTAGCLIVKIPSPISGRWLLIDTCDDEITLTYSAYYTHFDLESRSCEAAAIDFLRAFTREETVIAIGMHNNKLCGSAKSSAPIRSSRPEEGQESGKSRAYFVSGLLRRLPEQWKLFSSRLCRPEVLHEASRCSALQPRASIPARQY